MELDFDEGRVLGCLIEKATTTPDSYPLTTNALVGACNQRTNRDPVVEMTDRQVDAAMLGLREKQLARSIKGTGRAVKHRHVAGETLMLDDGALAVLAVLLLRGSQTVGEIRARTERMHPFAELDEVEGVLETLVGRHEPLVLQLPRQPGQKEARYRELLIDGTERGPAAVPRIERPPPDAEFAAPEDGAAPHDQAADLDELKLLRSEVAELRRRLDELCRRLGEDIP